MSIKFRFAVPVVALMLGAAAAPTFAQNNAGGQNGQNGGGQNGGGQNGGGGRGGWNLQQMMDHIKADLGATDDEFTAIQPKIEKVMQAQRDSRVNPFGGGRNRRGGGGDANGGAQTTPPESALATAVADLKKTTDDKDAKPDDIKTKLEAVRAAKKTAMDDLLKAQEDLKSVLTQKQEAILVERGTLD